MIFLKLNPPQLFVYLFAPVAHHLKESDLQNFRLDMGLKLWQGMWEYRSPNVQCFLAPVKPKARQYLQTTSSTSQSREGEPVFAGKQHESPTNTSFSETPKHDDEMSLCIASPKEPVFPETIPEEASSIEEEHVLLLRLPQGPDPGFYTADASLLHQSHFHSRRSSRGSTHSKDRFHESKHTTKFDFDKIEAFEKRHDEAHKPKGSSSTERESIDTDIKSPPYQKGEKGFTRQR
jgi:protein unc-80